MKRYDKEGITVVVDLDFEDLLVEAEVRQTDDDDKEYEVEFYIGQKEGRWWSYMFKTNMKFPEFSSSVSPMPGEVKKSICDFVYKQMATGRLNGFMEQYKHDLWHMFEMDKGIVVED